MPHFEKRKKEYRTGQRRPNEKLKENKEKRN
jgi:hypothetical protein